MREKKIREPFDEIEDICGVRVICYYTSDVDKVTQIIKNEFQILESQNKSDLLGVNEFAYRSQHFIVKTNSKWNAAPNYRDLGNLKAEIQVRTILMHTWAEIEHKLNYKNKAQYQNYSKGNYFGLVQNLRKLTNNLRNYESVSKVIKTI